MSLDFVNFLKEIGLCDAAQTAVLKSDAALDRDSLAPLCQPLFDPEADEPARASENALGKDPDGMKMLACMARCALHTRELYARKGIPDSIFIDTMKFLSRFVNEQAARKGVPSFRWGWWFPRQLSLREFRLGIFEYELVDNGPLGRCISLHIPSDARLTDENIRTSFASAHRFFAEFFPQAADRDLYCESRLLSPCLNELLPPASNILHFQSFFLVLRTDGSSPAFRDWVFPDAGEKIEDLPENTLLQRNAKKYLLAGNNIGWTLAKAKPEFWNGAAPSAMISPKF